MRIVLPLLLLSFLCTSGRAQIGLHPPRIDYQQIEAEHARIIFSVGYEARAQRVAAMIDVLQANHTRSIGEKIFPIDLVLQTATTEINGYVGLGPFRSEFYTTPPQSMNLLSGTDWVDLLTIHEYRHVQQNSNERRGLTKLLSYLQGQNGWSVFSFLATPNWFSEGDAVVYETAMTRAGRGRTPAFSADLRSLLANDIIYPYAKARNGSFDELVPDHYRYGYNTLTYARERFGNDVWRQVLHDGAAYKGLIYPFNRALKKQTGYGTKQLYRIALKDLKAKQDSALAARGPLTEGEVFGHQPQEITNYRIPFVDGQGRVIALRSGFTVTPELVVVDEKGKRDKVLTSVGIQREPYLYLRDNLAVWMEQRQNPRYTNEVYSDIIRYELKTGQKVKLTTGGKYFSPALSFDRQRIVAVEHDPTKGDPAIVVLASNTGGVIERLPIRAQAVSFPRFSPDGETIYFYHRDFDGVALHALTLATGEQRVILERSNEPRDYLQVTADGQLVYSNGRDGIDNIYLTDPANGQTTQLTQVAIGATFPYRSRNDDLYYSEATPVGVRLRRLATSHTGANKVPLAGRVSPAGPSVFERPGSYAAEAFDVTASVREKNYLVSDFNDDLGGVKLHSWSFNGSYVAPGLTVEATNALNTVRMSAAAVYNIDEARTTVGVNAEYGGFFPVVSAGANTSGRLYNTLDIGSDTIIINESDFNQQRFNLGLAIPLRWVAGDFVSSLTPAVDLAYFRIVDREEGPAVDNFASLGVSLSGSFLHRVARKQVQSRWGITMRLGYDQALGEGDGQRFLLRSSLFLPGAFRTHGLRLDFDTQAQNVRNRYQYVNAFQYARGYGLRLSDRVSRIGINYQLPLLYPDFGLFGITYFQRVRLNMFYDYSRVDIDELTLRRPSFSSAGGQFFFDNVWMNSAPITIGLELAYLLDAFAGQERVAFRLLVSGGF